MTTQSLTAPALEWARFAPSLAHLVPQLLQHEAVLAGYGSGPQPQSTLYDPAEPEHLCVLIDNPWQQEQWVTIYANECRWFDGGEPQRCSFEQLLAYMSQLPKPLHAFGEVSWND